MNNSVMRAALFHQRELEREFRKAKQKFLDLENVLGEYRQKYAALRDLLPEHTEEFKKVEDTLRYYTPDKLVGLDESGRELLIKAGEHILGQYSVSKHQGREAKALIWQLLVNGKYSRELIAEFERRY